MSANEPANAAANVNAKASSDEKQARKIDREELEMYMAARGDVFGDPDKFGVAMIVTYVHRETPVTVEYIFSSQGEIGMHLTRKKIEKFLEKWLNKGYVERSEAGYVPTKKMILALKADGITEERLDRMADALYGTKS